MDSDGTVIISDGELSGGSDYTRKMAEKHCRPWIHVDANKHSVEGAAEIIRAWINGSQIKVLNVAGSRASKDPKIYVTTKRLLTVLINMMSLGNRESQDAPG